MATANNVEDCIVKLLENEPPVYANAVKTLLRIFNNIQQNQSVEKFRKLRLSSKVVSENILPANGAMECLFACGFVEVENYYSTA